MNIFNLFKRETRNQIDAFLSGEDLTPAVTSMTPNNALSLSAVQACVKVLSEDIASLPFFVYKSTKDGKEKAKDHPMYKMLHLQPNPWQDSFTFFSTAMTQILLWGNCYIEMMYKRGEVEGMFLIHPSIVEKFTVKGKPWYKIKLEKEDRFLRDDYMIHLMYMSTDGFNGISPIKEACDTFDLNYYAQRYGKKFFQNGANTGGVLEHPNTLGEPAQERLRKSISEKNVGIENSHRFMILEEGMKFSRMSFPPNEAQMLETRKFQTEDIARIYRVPLHMIQSLDRATNNNIEHQGLDYVKHSLRPWLVRWEKILKLKLFNDTDYFAEFKVDGLLRGDYKTRMEGYSIARQNGFMSVNEIRDLENLNKIPEGDTFLQPLNMTVVGEDTGGDKKEAERHVKRSETTNNEQVVQERRVKNASNRHKITKSYENLMKKAFEAVVKREKADIMRQIEKMKQRKPVDVITFLEKFYDKHDEFMMDKIYPVAESLARTLHDSAVNEINGEYNEQESDKMAKEWSSSFVQKYIARHRGQLIKLINENREEDDPEWFNEVEERIDEWTEKQPQKSSLESTVQLAGFIVAMTFLSRDRRLMWINTGDDTCPYCENMNGMVVGRDQSFAQNGSSVLDMNINGDKHHPPLHEGCVCQLAPV